MSDVKLWLESLGLEKYADVFVSHDIDLAVAPDLTEEDLEKLGLSLGHRRKFIAAATKLRVISAAPVDAPAQARSVSQATQQVERRQVTVVFADLVGSTALANQLDPEDMSRLLRKYRDSCTAAIGKYDGFIAQYLGDGVLAYFGFPVAQEHGAERAVRAGLEIVEEVGRVKRPDGLPLQSRVGIATGLVVAGDAGGAGAEGEQTVVGDTPNLAARLQSLAEPGCVLVGPSTHQLTGDFFEYLFVGEHEVRGFREPVSMWRALGESAIESRFAAARAAAAGPIVGRERELVFMLDSWQRATRGNGHAVLVSGEAGMGKSRLVEAFAERVRAEPHRLLRCQCSPYHRNSVLYPITQLLRHRLDIRRDLPGAENLQRIDSMLAQFGRASRAARLLLAELLEVPCKDMLSPVEMTPEQRKNEMLAILEYFLSAPLDGTPVLLLLEDAHWSDATTQTLVERLLKRIETERALILITHRPELKTTWAEHPQATLISCKQLGKEQCAALVRHVAGRMPMEDSLIREIVARSDGVPLYVEELTKAVLDLRTARSSAVPLTLQDSLMARLDRLGRAKEIAQIASVIGRRFSYASLAAIAGAGDQELRAALGRLRESGLIFAAGEEGEFNYSFNHSLVQEAAYESLSRTRRQTLHLKIAVDLESRPSSAGAIEPTLIAHHYGRAAEAEKSFRFWMLAADTSGRRLAFAESVANLNSALAEAERVPDAALRARLKLDAQLDLGAMLVIHTGATSDEAKAAMAEAYRLAGEIDAGPQLFQATWGLYLNAARSRQFDKALTIGEELIAISQRLGDEDLKFEALHHRWGYVYFTGQTAKMLEYSAQGMKLYDRERHHRFSHVFAGHDPGVCAYCIHALALGVAGRGRSARPALESGLVLAEALQHPTTLVWARGTACFAMHLAGETDACGEMAEQLVQLATRYDFPVDRAIGSFWLGAVRTMRDDLAPGIKLMEPVFEATLGVGFWGVLPGVVMVDALARAGRDREALALIERLLDASSAPEVGVSISELWRIRGELVLRASAGNPGLAERYLRIALRVSADQGAKVFHLRTGISLARLLAESGRRDEAQIVLAQVDMNSLNEWSGPEMAVAGQLRSELN